MRLLLIRHALTPHVGHKLSGWSSGVHLSDEGRAQAARLTERLHDVQIDAIYSSPLDRAVETAQPIAKDHKLRVRQREEIGEVKYVSESYDIDGVDRITVDAVGEPGERTFYVQAQSGPLIVTLLAEKEQVRLLAEALLQLLGTLPDVDEGAAPEAVALALEGPLE